MLTTAVLLFFIIDPFGLIPLYIGVLRRVPEHRRTRVLLRELLIALVALIVFLFAGRYLLEILHISQPALTIAGAIILLLLALPMIFPTIRISTESEGGGEPLVVPLAIPLFAGPSALAMVMLIGSGQQAAAGWPSWLGSVGLAWLAASLVLLAGNKLSNRIGPRGLTALERLVGMLLVAIAVEMFLSGLAEYLQTLSEQAGA